MQTPPSFFDLYNYGQTRSGTDLSLVQDQKIIVSLCQAVFKCSSKTDEATLIADAHCW